jgi:hypothetical protein
MSHEGEVGVLLFSAKNLLSGAKAKDAVATKGMPSQTGVDFKHTYRQRAQPKCPTKWTFDPSDGCAKRTTTAGQTNNSSATSDDKPNHSASGNPRLRATSGNQRSNR